MSPEAPPDVLGHRLVLGVLIPSTNTVVEPEYHDLRPPGVTVQTGRLLISRPDVGSDDAFRRLMDQVEAALKPTIANLVTCRPDRIALGMTALAFLGGAKGNLELTDRLEQLAQRPVVTGPTAMVRALRAVGARRVAVLDPYQPFAESEAVRLFEEEGLDVLRTRSLRSVSATSIAQVPPDRVRALVEQVDGDDVDAIVQIGTNLAMARLAGDLEAERGKPVLAINTATVWACLRDHGISDRRDDVGTLLRDH